MKKLVVSGLAVLALTTASLSSASAAVYTCSWIATPYGPQQVCNWVPAYSCSLVQTPYGLQQACGYY